MGTVPDRVTLAAWIALILIGGGNAVGVKVSVDELPIFWAAGLRFGVAALVFAAVMLGLRIAVGSRGSLIGAVLYGVTGFGVPFALLYWAIQDAPAGTVQVIIALEPLAVMAFAIVHGVERFRWRGVAGGAIALLGVTVVFADQLTASVPLLALLAMVAATLSLGESSVIVKLTPRAHPVVTNAIGIGVGAAMLLGVSLLAGERWALPEQSDTWVALGFLIVGGSVAVFGLFVFIIGRWAASAAAYSLVLWPIPAVIYEALLLGRGISPAFVLGGVILVAGVWIGALAPDRRAPAVARP